MSVEEFIQHTANIQTMDAGMLHLNVTIIQYQGTNAMMANKQQYLQQLKQIKASGGTSELTDFKMLSKQEAGEFVSVVYRFKSTFKMGSTVMASDLTAHDVLQKTPSGFLLLFSVAK
ncbi:MAG: hypothetical protein ABIR94_04435 [Rubrivivax sp.]